MNKIPCQNDVYCDRIEDVINHPIVMEAFIDYYNDQSVKRINYRKGGNRVKFWDISELDLIIQWVFNDEDLYNTFINFFLKDKYKCFNEKNPGKLDNRHFLALLTSFWYLHQSFMLLPVTQDIFRTRIATITNFDSNTWDPYSDEDILNPTEQHTRIDLSLSWVPLIDNEWNEITDFDRNFIPEWIIWLDKTLYLVNRIVVNEDRVLSIQDWEDDDSIESIFMEDYYKDEECLILSDWKIIKYKWELLRNEMLDKCYILKKLSFFKAKWDNNLFNENGEYYSDEEKNNITDIKHIIMLWKDELIKVSSSKYANYYIYSETWKILRIEWKIVTSINKMWDWFTIMTENNESTYMKFESETWKFIAEKIINQKKQKIEKRQPILKVVENT